MAARSRGDQHRRLLLLSAWSAERQRAAGDRAHDRGHERDLDRRRPARVRRSAGSSPSLYRSAPGRIRARRGRRLADGSRAGGDDHRPRGTLMVTIAALINVSSNLGYLLPAIIGLESMGIPSPGETALVAAAVLASQGRLNIVLVIVIGVASAIIGDNIGYLIGRRLGRDVLSAPGPGQQHRIKALEAGDRFYDKHGSKAVFFGRWVALVRVAAAWLAGINHMPFRRFFFWNALGGLTWGITVGVLG